MKTKLLLLSLFTLCAVTLARGQTNAPPLPGGVTTNNLPGSTVSGVALIDWGLSLIPAIDTTATNSFVAGEIDVSAGRAWKSPSVGIGATPFTLLRGGYYFTRNIGFGGELVMFGNGSGGSTLDSASAFLLGRVDRGNVALYTMLGIDKGSAGNPDNLPNVQGEKLAGRAGFGVAYRYSTKIELAVDTSYIIWGTESTKSSWLTGVSVGYHF